MMHPHIFQVFHTPCEEIRSMYSIPATSVLQSPPECLSLRSSADGNDFKSAQPTLEKGTVQKH